MDQQDAKNIFKTVLQKQKKENAKTFAMISRKDTEQRKGAKKGKFAKHIRFINKAWKENGSQKSL